MGHNRLRSILLKLNRDPENIAKDYKALNLKRFCSCSEYLQYLKVIISNCTNEIYFTFKDLFVDQIVS